MENKEGEELCNTNELDEETVALQKKRRRVSFAELTSVHVFYTDEEIETPPESKPGDEPVGFHKDDGESDDSKGSEQLEDDDDEEEGEGGGEAEDEEEGGLFVHNMNFSSPGSEVGSVMSNEEDNFFGPVSTSFIRSGRLSTESANSNDNHDVTLDSTAFSLHFRSLLQSHERSDNTEGNLKTPTALDVTFRERTPTGDSMPSNPDSFMILTRLKGPVSDCSSNGKSSNCSDSNEMSLVVENPDKYDYGRLSPRLDALLAEARSNLQNGSNSNQSKSPKLSMSGGKLSTLHEQGTPFMDLKDLSNEITDNTIHNSLPDEMVLDANIKSPGVGGAANIDPIGNCHHSPITKVSTAGGHPRSLTLCEATLGSDVDEDPGKDAVRENQSHIVSASAGKANSLSPLRKFPTDLSTQQDNLAVGHVGDGIEENHCFSNSSTTPVAKSPTLNLGNSHHRSSELSKDGQFTPSSGQNAAHDHEFPLSVSSLRAKRQRLFCDSVESSIKKWFSSPFASEKPFSSLSESVPSSKNSLSNFKNVELLESPISSPFASDKPFSSLIESITSTKNNTSEFKNVEVQEGSIDNSKQLFLIDACRPFPSGNILDENKDPNPKPVDASMIGVEEDLFTVAEKKSVQDIAIETSSTFGTPVNFSKLRNSVANRTILHHNGFRDRTPVRVLNSGVGSEVMAAKIPSYHVSAEREQVRKYPMNYQIPVEGAVGMPLPHSPQSLTATQHGSPKVTGGPNKVISSPVEKKLLASGIPKGTPLRILNQENQSGKVMDSSPRQEVDASVRVVTNLLTSTLGAEGTITSRSSPLVGESRDCFTMPLVNCSHELRNFSKFEEVANQGSFLHGFPKERESTSSQNVTLSIQPGSQERGFQRRLSPSSHKRMDTPTQDGEGLVDGIVQGAARKETYLLTDTECLHSLSWDGSISSKPIQELRGHENVDSHQGLHVLRKSLFTVNVESSVREQKGNEETNLTEKNHINEAEGGQSNQNIIEVERSALVYPSEQSIVHDNQTGKISGKTSKTHLTDVYSKFSASAKQLLPTRIDKLNLQQLGVLEDILDQLQTVKKYQILHSEIQTQKMDDRHSIKHQRELEARRLQHMLLYEKGRLQLQSVKRDRLLKQVQGLQSEIKQCFNHKSNLQCDVPGTGDAPNKGIYPLFLSPKFDGQSQDTHHRVGTMRQELVVLEKEIQKHTKSFHASCKIKGNPGVEETLVLVNDHLKKKARCWQIHQYLQLWKLDDIERKDGHCNIVLDFGSSLSQRFTAKDGPSSSIISCNLLNNANIIKNFSNMNAWTAFEFVFNAKRDHKLANLKCIQQETRMTGFLLGNLLDVLEEVQIARVELPDLTSASFSSPCIGQLDLHFCFMDFKTGRRVTLILDMTNINCPSIHDFLETEQRLYASHQHWISTRVEFD